MNGTGRKTDIFAVIRIFKKLFYFVIMIFASIIFQYNKDAGFILGCSGIIFASFIIDREKFDRIFPAILVGAVWILISHNIYAGYNVFKLKIFGISLFPILAWPTGLYAFHLFSGDLFSRDIWWKKWFKLSSIYSIGIITVEFLGYNVFHIHLDAGTAYSGWPVLNIFHCAWWMQVAYFMNGIMYLLIINSKEHYSWSVRRTFAYVYLYFR